jgi:hypothetical protein
MITDKIHMVRDVQDLTSKIDPWMFGLAIVVSLAAAAIAGALYQRLYERRGTGSQIHRAFPLLAISITALFICIQVSLPLSLGLLGALSIVRFRTPVKEPEEIAFIMLVVASSIICATFNFQYMAILYALVIGALLLIRRFRRTRKEQGDGLIVVTLRGNDTSAAQKAVEACICKHARYCATESVNAQDGISSIQFSFSGLSVPAADLQAAVVRTAEVAAFNLFFNRPAAVE